MNRISRMWLSQNWTTAMVFCLSVTIQTPRWFICVARWWPEFFLFMLTKCFLTVYSFHASYLIFCIILICILFLETLYTLNCPLPVPYLLLIWPYHKNMQVEFYLTISHATHTQPFNGSFPGLPRWAGTTKVKPIWILLKQATVSGSGISWAVCKSAPRSRQITMPAPHHWSCLQAGCLSYRPTIRYDTRCYFNVRSKADISQLNLPHGTDN